MTALINNRASSGERRKVLDSLEHVGVGGKKLKHFVGRPHPRPHAGNDAVENAEEQSDEQKHSGLKPHRSPLLSPYLE